MTVKEFFLTLDDQCPPQELQEPPEQPAQLSPPPPAMPGAQNNESFLLVFSLLHCGHSGS